MIDYGKRTLLGVQVDAIDIAAAVTRISYFARLRRPMTVTALAVHGVMESEDDPVLQSGLNDFDLVMPDGQPLVWSLNALYGLDLPEKVPGPTVVDRLLEVAADEDWLVYFYGSTPETLDGIRAELDRRFGGRLRVASEPSKFRPVDGHELDEIVERINASGANLCLVGLGCPRQERFVAATAGRINMPTLAVGAAFDYIAGSIERAPELWQQAGLEWLFRTMQEPRRLAKRYATTNTRFVVGIARQLAETRLARRGVTPSPPAPPRWATIDA